MQPNGSRRAGTGRKIRRLGAFGSKKAGMCLSIFAAARSPQNKLLPKRWHPEIAELTDGNNQNAPERPTRR